MQQDGVGRLYFLRAALCADHALLGVAGIYTTCGYCEECAYAMGWIEGILIPTEKLTAIAKAIMGRLVR